jgi:hypothetical protein
MSNPHLEHLNPLPPSPIHTLAAEPNHIKPHGTRSPRPCKPQSKPHWISGSGGQANRSDRPGPHTAVKYTSRREADRCRTCGAGDENAHRFLRHGCRWGGFAKVLEARGVGEWFWRRRHPQDSEPEGMGGRYLTTSSLWLWKPVARLR